MSTRATFPWRDKRTRLELAGVLLFGLASLLPFIGKPVHMDDPMMLWSVERILQAPLDPYGPDVNWHGVVEPMEVANNNPPLANYYLAAASRLPGKGVQRLHAAIALQVLALLLAGHALAQRLVSRPTLAVIVLWSMPGLLTTCTTLMVEPQLMALWCGAVWLWVVGLDQERTWMLAVAAFLASLAVLTKYLGVALVPLLGVYTLCRRRRLDPFLGWLLLPVVCLGGFDLAMRVLYDHSPLTYVGPRSLEGDGVSLDRGIVALSFLGGVHLVVLVLAPWLWSGRALVGWLGLAALLGALFRTIDVGVLTSPGTSAVVHLTLFCLAGAQIFALAGLDLKRHRSADSLLLFLWVTGIFVFAAVLNWTVNVRAVVVAAPAVALLLVRRLDRPERTLLPTHGVPVWLALVPAMLLSFGVAVGDHLFARAQLEAAHVLTEQLHSPSGRPLWFQGSWGFQFYMEKLGAQKVDLNQSELLPGDLLVSPGTNAGVLQLPLDVAIPLGRHQISLGWPVAVMASPPVGAGFYADLWGPLPYVVGARPLETYAIERIRQPFNAARYFLRGERRPDPLAPLPRAPGEEGDGD